MRTLDDPTQFGCIGQPSIKPLVLDVSNEPPTYDTYLTNCEWNETQLGEK